MENNTPAPATREHREGTILETEELEALRTRVAEWLGWRKMAYSRGTQLSGQRIDSARIARIPAYSRDLVAAWEIVEVVAKRGYRVEVAALAFGGTYRVDIGEGGNTISRAVYPSPAAAICLAFDLAAPLLFKHGKT
jgi:hypothetical protein